MDANTKAIMEVITVISPIYSTPEPGTENSTCGGNNSACTDTEDFYPYAVEIDPWTMMFATLYALICATGLLGNGLVIFVVLRYAKMKTVTNMYILNLAVADLCFLIGLPFLIVTVVVKNWVFGYWICKVFFISTSINWYTSVFTLTALSADRYFAVCHAIPSIRFRTPMISLVVCTCVWFVSFLAMLPMVLYTQTIVRPHGGLSCQIIWPDGPISGETAFIWYAFLLGFAIPTSLISVFYSLVVIKLHTVGPTKKSKERKKSNRKVTIMVLSVITVYVVCWLPYWVFQLALNYSTNYPRWTVSLFQILTLMSYANSMMNPVLYAFLSENFRVSFVKAFKCADASEVNNTLRADMSIAPNGHRKKSRFYMTSPSNRTKAEMSLLKAGNDEILTCNTALNSALDVKEPQDDKTNGNVTDTSKTVFVKAENGVHVVHPATEKVNEETAHYEG